MAERSQDQHVFDNDGELILTGSANAYVATVARSISGYFQGLRICGKANHNNSGAATLEIFGPNSSTGLGAVPIRKGVTTALASGDMISGKYYDFLYDATNSVFQLLGVGSAAAGGGDVVGPASATNNNLAAFDGTTGKLIKDSGISIANVLTEAEAAAAYQPLDAGLTDIAGLAVTDGNIIVGNGTNWVAESGATARTSLGLGTGDSPQFTNETLTGYLDMTEIAAPASPASNVARSYAVDDGSGVTTLAMKDSAGNIVPLSHFKPTGAGVVVRSMHSKNSDMISVTDFGADSTGASNATTAIQAALDFAASVVTARSTVRIPATWLGNTYRLDTPLTWPANVNIYCDPGVRIFANATMAAMLQSGVGSTGVRLRSVWLKGGRWDGNYLARRGFWIKDGNGVHLTDFIIVSVGTYVDGTTETESSYIRIGDPGQFVSCYEIMIDNFGLYRTDDAGSPTEAPALNYGVFSTDGASDCHVTNGVINGVKFGMADEMAHWKVNFVHVWNFQPDQGALVNGFYDSIGGVIYHGCQVDCATYEIPFRIDGTFHPNQIVASQVNCSLDTASSSDNVGTAISVGTGAQLAAIGNTITCDVTKRFATDFSGDLALLTTHGHQNKNVVSPAATSGVITPDGLVIAGHTAALTAPTGVIAKLQAISNGANAASLMARFSANASPGRVGLAKSRHATSGSHTIVQSGDGLGDIVAMGSNGTDFQNAAIVSFEVDGTPGTGADMPGRIVFKTSADGSSTPTERMRISADGTVTIATVPVFTNIPQNSQSTAYTTVLADAQKHILHPTADNNARTFTIAANASVAYPIGTAITFVNQINTVTIAITSDTMVLAGAGTTGSRTLAANGIATAIKIASTTWIISGTGLT